MLVYQRVAMLNDQRVQSSNRRPATGGAQWVAVHRERLNLPERRLHLGLRRRDRNPNGGEGLPKTMGEIIINYPEK